MATSLAMTASHVIFQGIAFILCTSRHVSSASSFAAGTRNAGKGFCLETRSPELEDTGFTDVSSRTSRQDCLQAGYEWCPLRNSTREWKVNGKTIIYYYFSACCTGFQGQSLIVDTESGLPSCRANMSADKCKRVHWHQKFLRDKIDPAGPSRYDYRAAPSLWYADPDYYGGSPIKSSCSCSPDAPNCEVPHQDGKRCTICLTDAHCADDDGLKIRVNMNFFKIAAIDLKSSEFHFSAWLRFEWYDSRLSYDYQCYGGQDVFDVQAEAGDLENSLIWTPDIDLFNAQQTIWQGSMAARLASVYSCWDGAPSRGGCGYTYWVRPGVIQALCKYQGLLTFPYDDLSCELEFGAFSIDGRFMDILFMTPPRGGSSWDGDGTPIITGITGGSSFQDYRISGINQSRKVVYYDCCPLAPFPELFYTVNFTRSRSFYVIILVVPAILLTFLSFVPYTLDPAIGERLGFAMAVMLAMIINNVIATNYMPICEEKLTMDFLNIAVILFGTISLLETSLVLYMYHLTVDHFWKAFLPFFIRQSIWKVRHVGNRDRLQKRPTRLRASAHANVSEGNKRSLQRAQGYARVFYLVDENLSGGITLEELHKFGKFMTGLHWNEIKAESVCKDVDSDFNGVLDLDEFIALCEEVLYPLMEQDDDYLAYMIEAYIQVTQSKNQAIEGKWKARAILIDTFSLYTFPLGFFLLLVFIHRASEEQMQKLNEGGLLLQACYLCIGLLPALVSALCCLIIQASDRYCARRQKRLATERRFDEATANIEVQESLVDAADDSMPDEIHASEEHHAKSRQDEAKHATDAYELEPQDNQVQAAAQEKPQDRRVKLHQDESNDGDDFEIHEALM
eukprot:TRINITY_DN41498_c0_g1_i1.p1 TRINITY_DN41498_c0_g1~~TRINITY_DN41498_c0_g1_i1.p1  ORF type:complete len:862 (-),score=120.36 TRINITY_DN41498_c0_g1_i1:328-2874(-)